MPDETPNGASERSESPPAISSRGSFTRLGAEIGLDFVHDSGWTGSRYMIETMGGGGGFFDYDGDGWVDLYLVQSGPVPWERTANEIELPRNQLFRNLGDGTFENVTSGSGLGDTGYGMGACFGDVDGDGRVDVAVTNYGSNRLFRNLGDGRFEDVSSAANFDDARWGTSCALADYDRDGDLDLYVANYYQYSLSLHRECGNPDFPTFCPPDYFAGESDLLYRNRGDGTFEDVTRAAGVWNEGPTEAKGLGAVWADLDNDHDLDLYVANDLTPNYIYWNEGGRFSAGGLASGAALNQNGVPEASMGVDVGDVDLDGRRDLFVTHFSFETNTLYRNLGGQSFQDTTEASGAGAPSLLNIGFGTVFLDWDLDGDEDLFVTNGHISDNIHLYNPTERYRQQDQLLENRAGRFHEISAASGIHVEPARVGRGAATADIDNDGDLDLLVVANRGPAEILRNDRDTGGPWVVLDLVLPSGAPAVGARARIAANDREQTRDVAAGSSYLSQSDTRLHFGLGGAAAIEWCEIRWPDGTEEIVNEPNSLLNRITRIQQTSG